MLIALSLFAFIHPDLRAGEAAVEGSGRFAMLTLVCEVPVLALGLTSLAGRKRVYWTGCITHLAFALWLIIVIVWLTYFWHW